MEVLDLIMIQDILSLMAQDPMAQGPNHIMMNQNIMAQGLTMLHTPMDLDIMAQGLTMPHTPMDLDIMAQDLMAQDQNTDFNFYWTDCSTMSCSYHSNVQ